MKRSLILIALLFVMMVPVAVHAQQDQDTCRSEISRMLGDEHSRYRRAVFGSTGATIFKDGASAIRTGGTSQQGNGWGIMETPRRMSSELVEPLVEAYRTFRCRSNTICELLGASVGRPENSSVQYIPVAPLGCESRQEPLIGACFLGTTATSGEIPPVLDYCNNAVNGTLEFERRVLELTVAYDTGYRSLLQFSGMFDAFLVDVPMRTFTAVRQMVGLLGKLHQVPCFTAHCDLPPKPEASSSSSSSSVATPP